MMLLKSILDGVKFKAHGTLCLGVSGITDNSREVKKGRIFIALKGHTVDGHKFIDEAIRRGAAAVICEKDFSAPGGMVKILIDDSRSAIPIIAGNFYGHPSRKLKVVGITGTNGKTTITYIIENILKRCGKDAAVIGTVSYRLKDRVTPAKNTTPGPLELQSMLAEAVNMGLDYAVMEVSSHSLDQNRVGEVGFDVGIFTNITSDHLDYHKTAANYFNAKKRLFDNLKAGGTAILNNDDRKAASLKSGIKHKIITYGVTEAADVKAEDIRLSLEGSRFSVVTPGGKFDVSTRLIGRHNVSNILAGITAGLALNIDPGDIKRGVESAIYVPGRLEAINAGQPFKVYVDYAHTEDALYNILTLLRDVAGKRIITVFGCGGDRDRTKRPLMGKVACEFSDMAIITSDNPRFEDPDRIINDILDGIKGKFRNYDVIADRKAAIEKAIKIASPGDVVVIAGKGHEDYQIMKDKALAFDDRKVAREILRNYEGKRDSKNNTRKAVVG